MLSRERKNEILVKLAGVPSHLRRVVESGLHSMRTDSKGRLLGRDGSPQTTEDLADQIRRYARREATAIAGGAKGAGAKERVDYVANTIEAALNKRLFGAKSPFTGKSSTGYKDPTYAMKGTGPLYKRLVGTEPAKKKGLLRRLFGRKKSTQASEPGGLSAVRKRGLRVGQEAKRNLAYASGAASAKAKFNLP